MNWQEGLYGYVKIVVLDVVTMKVHMQRFLFVLQNFGLLVIITE